MPIREEVVERHGDVVITRNSYGARCLNTPDVLFADVDLDGHPGAIAVLAQFVAHAASAVGVAVWQRPSGFWVAGLVLAALVSAYPAAYGFYRLRVRLRGGEERLVRSRIENFVRRHPRWHLRVYRTPAGFRVLALHRTFETDDPEVSGFFFALGADSRYAEMCRRQRCFRARVSAKPWRIGIVDRLRPRPGVWPVKPEHLPRREAWLRDYDARAAGFAACRFIEEFGSRDETPKTAAVRELHDRLGGALGGRPIA